MKKLTFMIFTYLLCFAAPALIVEYYDHFVESMSPGDKRMAIMAGTLGVIIMAIFTGFGSRKTSADVPKSTGKNVPKVPKTTRKTVSKGPRNGDTRIVRDPATGAERLYHWNEKDGTWDSDDGTYLDEDRLADWEKQRLSDRRWQDEQMRKLREGDTALDRELREMKKKEQEELAKMEKENEERDRFAERHGVYETTAEDRKKWLDDMMNKESLNSREQTEYANEFDKIVNRLEWIQWAADTGVDICDICSLGTLKPIKYIYITSRNMASEMMDATVRKKGLTTGVTRGLIKTGIDITQDRTSKIGYKYAVNGLGDGIKGAMDAEEGKRTKAFFKEGLKGTLRTGIEHGMQNVKLPKSGKAAKIAKETTEKSSRILGLQQSGALSEKTANGLRQVIRSDGAQKIAKETTKNKDLLNTGLGKLSDGIVNFFRGD